MRADVRKATAWGLATAGVLAILIVAGSRRLSRFDASLVAYTFAVLFATFGIAYRYAMWLQRPPTAMYWRRGWQVFVRRGHRGRNAAAWARRVVSDIAMNRFILARDRMRGVAHLLIMWGCLLAVAITFPLVFGWLHFESMAPDLERYRAYFLGVGAFAFPVHSAVAFLLFHGLVWAAVLVIAGVMVAMRRRMREEGAVALQRFGEDFLPLIMLFAVSVSGLMLTASYTWMHGYAFDFLAILHAITVIATFLWLPFGKFFHVFQRPAQLGVAFYKDVGLRGEPANCARCGHPFTSRMHVEDLIRVERELGYRYTMAGSAASHYQWICPPCRRAMLALAQGCVSGRASIPAAGRSPALQSPMPMYVNPAMGEGPLGAEDRENRHA